MKYDKPSAGISLFNYKPSACYMLKDKTHWVMCMYRCISNIMIVLYQPPLKLLHIPPLRGINERSMIYYVCVREWFLVSIFKLWWPRGWFLKLDPKPCNIRILRENINSLTMGRDCIFASVFFQLKCTISPNFAVFLEMRDFYFVLVWMHDLQHYSELDLWW